MALSYIAHATNPSIFYLDEDWWADTVQKHATEPVFRVRPFTTTAVQWLHDKFDVGYRIAWFGLQFALMFLSCAVFYVYLTTLGVTHRQSIVGELLYGLSPPVFMAHFEPMYTWDDFWIYLLVPLSLALLKKRQLPLAAIAFGCALAAREVTFLFLPVWIFLVYREEKKVGDTIMWGAVAVVLFASIRWGLTGDFRSPAELQLEFNFATLLRTKNTLFSVWFACGAFWIIGLVQATRLLRTDRLNPIAWGAWLVSAGYVSSALLLARAMETRVMFPPAILLIPLTLLYFQGRADVISRLRTRLGRWKWPLLLLLLAAAGIAVIELSFPTFEYRRWYDGHWFFAGLHLAGFFLFLLLEWSARASKNLTRR